MNTGKTLTDAQRKAIDAAVASGIDPTTIAGLIGVHPRTVTRYLAGQTWRAEPAGSGNTELDGCPGGPGAQDPALLSPHDWACPHNRDRDRLNDVPSTEADAAYTLMVRDRAQLRGRVLSDAELEGHRRLMQHWRNEHTGRAPSVDDLRASVPWE